MKKFYLHNGTEQEGPFNHEELKDKNVSKGTLIWHEEIEDWTPLEQIDELKYLIVKTPPPLVKTPPPLTNIYSSSIEEDVKIDNSTNPINNSTNPSKKDTKSKKYIIAASILIPLILIFLFFANQNSSYDNSYGASGSYQDNVASIEQMEVSQPTTFLTAEGQYNQNFSGNKIKLSGTMTNTATVTTYTNIVVRVTCYNGEEYLGSEEHTIYDVFPPNSTINFKLKSTNYSNANKLSLDVVNASVKY